MAKTGQNGMWDITRKSAARQTTATYPVETIAALLDLTPRRVQQLASEGHIPKAERGRYELVPSVKGYIRYLKDRAINADVQGGEEGDHKRRLMKARADIAEMEAERISGNQIEVDAVERTWVAAASRFRQKMLSIAYKAAPIVAVETDIDTIHDKLESMIHEGLGELANLDVQSTATAGEGDSQDTEGDLATAEIDGEPVG